MSGRIQALSDIVIRQIAAGEVLERPASAVKELLENAIDAGAQNIILEIAGAGRQKIRIADDGSGMNREDALLSIERHTTSKIAALNDLERLKTFGFRGEAMSSMAAVARMRIKTRARGENEATEIFIEGGKVQNVKATTRPPALSF
jgi:DNA mismatch repair protein MutL